MDQMSGDMNKHHMWMWFHTTLDDTVLFEFWLIDAPWKMVLSCTSIFILGIALEALRFLRFKLSINSSASLPCRTNYRLCALSEAHALQTLLFTVEVILGYILMLVFMTFSVWLGLAVILGIAFGYYIFGYRPLYSSVSLKQSTCQTIKE